MLNVNKLTSMLAKMQDPQLQQYAQLHKNDPYIVSLVMSESNRRKEVRAVTPPMGEQPKVVDREIAQMDPQRLPEEQGIGRIPAGDMNFAGGGIIAFADGGDVERYQSQGLVQPQFVQDLAGLPQAFDDWKQRAREEDARKAEADKRMAQKRQEMLDARSKTSLSNYLFGSPQREAEGVAEYNKATAPENLAPAKATPAKVTPTYSPEDLSGMDRRIMSGSSLPNIQSIAPPPKAKADDLPPSGARLPAQAGLGGLDVTKMTDDALKAAGEKPNPFAKDFTDIGAEKVKAKEAEVAGLEAIQKQFSDVFKGRKERLDKREGDIETMKDQGLGLALLQAGATMMTTRGNLGTAVGAGVDVGTKQYASGLDKIRSAQEKLSDARDRLEELETNRNEMSARELNKARNEVKTAGISAREDLLKANMQMYNVNRETALKMVDNQVKVGIMQTEQAGALARTQMQVGAPGQTERLIERMKDPKFAAAYKDYAAIGPEAKGLEADLQAYIKNPMMLKATNPDLAAQFDAVIKQRMASMVKPQEGAGSRG
jgi:hypothetical protein